jgi:predicted phosphodiesterase
MRIQVISDIHAEFHQDSGKQFVTEYLRPKGVDVLVLAGDAGVGRSLGYSLKLLSKHYANAVVLYVPGNHDFYNSGFIHVLRELRMLESSIDNLFVLNNKMMNINGINFVGSPMWFKQKKNYKKYTDMINDFSLITNFEDKVFKENKKALKFLRWHVNSDSVVITHHVPTPKSTPDRYVGDPINMFFTCDMEELIRERKPKLWVHGHTHDSFNYMLGKTHIVCNPLGYVGRQVNAEFIPNMMIDL